MNGAMARIKGERSLAWQAAFLPYSKKPPSLADFIAMKPEREPPVFLEMRLRSATKGLRGISMAEHLRSVRH